MNKYIMPDLLTPEEVEEINRRIACLCRDYLTLWNRNKKLEAESWRPKDSKGIIWPPSEAMETEKE